MDANYLQGALEGFMSALLIVFTLGIIFTVKRLRQNDIYDLDHWKLNAKVPPTTMWMNMGYWKPDGDKPVLDLDQACTALLRKVLSASELHEFRLKYCKLSILDLGIGCGDQTLVVAQEMLNLPVHPADFEYVGLTLNQAQLLHGQASLRNLPKDSPVQVFQADASKPDTWSPEVNDAVKSLRAPNQSDNIWTWVLALDCLYHFSPSRIPIFRFAAQELRASFMAFDLMLNETATFKERLIIKLLSLAMKCPWEAFVTEEQYKQQLKDAGYAGQIDMEDITEHVFAGLASHIERQEKALRPYGISLGKYKLAGKMFAWLARTKALKAVIVVARRKPKTA